MIFGTKLISHLFQSKQFLTGPQITCGSPQINSKSVFVPEGFCTAFTVVCCTVGTGCTEPNNRTNIGYTLGLQHYLKKPWSVRWKPPHACWIHHSYTKRSEHQLETVCWGPTVPVQIWVISACDGADNLQWFTWLKNKLQWVLVYLKTWDKNNQNESFKT